MKNVHVFFLNHFSFVQKIENIFCLNEKKASFITKKRHLGFIIPKGFLLIGIDINQVGGRVFSFNGWCWSNCRALLVKSQERNPQLHA